MFMASFMFLAGNYIYSTVNTFEREFEYSDKLVMVSLQSTDEEFNKGGFSMYDYLQSVKTNVSNAKRKRQNNTEPFLC